MDFNELRELYRSSVIDKASKQTESPVKKHYLEQKRLNNEARKFIDTTLYGIFKDAIYKINDFNDAEDLKDLKFIAINIPYNITTDSIVEYQSTITTNLNRHVPGSYHVSLKFHQKDWSVIKRAVRIFDKKR